MTDWKEFEKLSTLELIELIKMRKEPDFFERSQGAFHAFTFRFSEEVSKKCEIICTNWNLDLEFAAEVASQTFERFWKYPKFDPQKIGVQNIDKAVLLYLFRISKNVLIDLWHKRLGTERNPYDGSEEIVWDYPSHEHDCGEIKDSLSHQAIVKKAVDSLSQKHKIVFLTYAKYHTDGYKLPRHLLSQLRKELNISQQTIRSYKHEAVKKVEEYLKIYEIKKNRN